MLTVVCVLVVPSSLIEEDEEGAVFKELVSYFDYRFSEGC